jgi:hypothetical protein
MICFSIGHFPNGKLNRIAYIKLLILPEANPYQIFNTYPCSR